jgi:hypothetical protein
MGYGTPDGKYDGEKLKKEYETVFTKSPKLLAAITKECIDNDQAYGPPDMCPLLKMRHCAWIQYLKVRLVFLLIITSNNKKNLISYCNCIPVNRFSAEGILAGGEQIFRGSSEAPIARDLNFHEFWKQTFWLLLAPNSLSLSLSVSLGTRHAQKMSMAPLPIRTASVNRRHTKCLHSNLLYAGLSSYALLHNSYFHRIKSALQIVHCLRGNRRSANSRQWGCHLSYIQFSSFF